MPARFTIVIPTRERAFTLEATLRTCTSEDRDDLEILVSDNASTDATRDVVTSQDDPRVRYVNTGTRLSMTDNWEFALSHVKEGFVTFLGDDDGLVPHAIADVARVVEATGAEALSWVKAEYCWPNHPVAALRNLLVLPLANDMFRVTSAHALRDLCRFLFPYSRSPTLYNSFVSKALMDRNRNQRGRFFGSIAPDVYSGIVLLAGTENYWLSSRPFSINGASAKSTGTSGYGAGSDRSAALQFFSELGERYDYAFGHVASSVHSVVAECLYEVNRSHLSGRLPLNARLMVFRILLEVSRKGAGVFEEARHDLESIGKRFRISGTVARLQRWIRASGPVAADHPLGVGSHGELSIDTARFGASSVNGAAQLAGRLLPSYAMPDRVTHIGGPWRLVRRGFNRLLRPRLRRFL